MNVIAKFIKAMFFEDGEVNLSLATKCKYIVYGIVLSLAIEAVAIYMMDEDIDVTEIVDE